MDMLMCEGAVFLKSVRGNGFPGAGVTGICESSNVDARN